MENSPITITINWQQDDDDAERQERQTETLYRELRQMDEVDAVNRVADLNVPDGGMGAAWLWSVLQAEVTLENLGKLYSVVRDRLPGKPMEFEVSNGDRKVVVKGVRPEAMDGTLEKLIAAAKELGAN
ncbi:MAG: hypothetical protein F6K09_18150 [Merismopedia sp. SIO2A8]|nr:hypothetical protein [Merismopedia sp. SIO2A8]